MIMEFSGVIFILLSFLQLCSCYEHYQNAIPNGDKVNHPCLPNYMWKGVGHYNQRGGGHRNPFGIDFASGGHKWTKELCQKDSDGDGKSNGDELGDPDCTWTPGTVPKRTTEITHPGVCEPVTTATCQQRNAQFTDLCKSPEFQCSGINSTDVFNMTIRFKNTTIPNKVTNYYCQSFEIPGNDTYHMIGTEALIDNAEVMHHMLLFGCTTKPSAATFTQAKTCGMAMQNCFNIVSLWSVGIAGICFPNSYGILLGSGQGAFKYFVLQFHWNNPTMRSGMTDASGLRLYLTKNLRPNNGGFMLVGQRYLELPPGQVKVEQNMTCSSQCSNLILRSQPNISISGASIHMHYNGRFGKLEHWRKGKKLRDIVPYGKVEYDNPKILMFDPPIIFERGDEFKLLCEYNTVGNTGTIFYGDGTQDEMCFAFVLHSPKLTFTRCVNYGPIDLCRSIDAVGNCNYTRFNAYLYTVGASIHEFCDYSVNYCSPKCKEIVREINKQPCMQGWAKKFLYLLSTYDEYALAGIIRQFRLQISSCEQELLREGMTTPLPATKAPNPPRPAPFLNESTQLAILITACVVGALLIITVVIIGLVKAFTQSGTPSTSKAKHSDFDNINNAYTDAADSTHF